MCKRDESPSFTVKKAGKYSCIKSESLKFLDTLQFLAPGYSLKSFFKAFDANEEKGFFPYDYFTHQLDETSLRPYETFYSSIKGCNVLEKTILLFRNLSTKGNPNKKPYKFYVCRKYQKLGLKIISGFNSYGLKISGPLLQIF